MRELIPHGTTVVIKAPSQKKNAAGIEMHRSSQERPLEGTIIAAGEECRYYKVGDEVAYTRFNVNEVDIDGDIYFVMEEKQVLAGIKEVE